MHCHRISYNFIQCHKKIDKSDEVVALVAQLSDLKASQGSAAPAAAAAPAAKAPAPAAADGGGDLDAQIKALS